MSRPIRLTVMMTHPIQYYSPWFRFIASAEPELALSVLYVSEPLPEQQGARFGASFRWDVPLLDGYENEVLRAPSDGADFGSDRFLGLDHPAIGEAVANTRPDVVLLSGWHSASQVRTMFACRRREVPLLYRGDSVLGARVQSWAWRLRTRFLLSRFDRYLSVGLRAHEYLRFFAVAEDRIHPSPHAVDNGFFAERARAFREPVARADARAAIEVPDDAFVVLFVGKIERKKRVADLVRAVAELQPPAVLVVVGSGPLEQECRAAASKLGVSVRWRGFLNQSELGRAYGVADCLALPSDWGETWGLVVNEAMATGLPCVVSDRVGCAPDLVLSGRTGETFPCGDVDSLASALERVRNGDDRSRACEKYAGRFSFGAATKGLVEACRNAVR